MLMRVLCQLVPVNAAIAALQRALEQIHEFRWKRIDIEYAQQKSSIRKLILGPIK